MMDGDRAFRAFSVLCLCLIVFTRLANAVPQDFKPAAVTARAQLPRDATATFGWFSAGESDGQTTYDPVTYDPENQLRTFAGFWYDGELLTSCGGGIVEGPETARSCPSSLSQCLTEALLPSYGATVPLLRKVTCIALDWVPRTYFKEKPLSSYDSTQPPIDFAAATTTDSPSPTQPVSSSASTSASPAQTSSFSASTSASPTQTSASQTQTTKPTTTIPSTSTASSSPATNNPTDHKHTDTAIIAGSVIGGIALIGFFILGAIWLMRKTRNRNRSRSRSLYEDQPPLIEDGIEVYKATAPSLEMHGSGHSFKGELYGDTTYARELEGSK